MHDLTGFNGRCDALYFTSDEDDRPPDDGQELAELRRRMLGEAWRDEPDVYDFAVVGGGVAGVCAALAAAWTGATGVLLEVRPVLGGCNSSEVRVLLGGLVRAEPYPNLGNVLEQISPAAAGFGDAKTPEMFEDARKGNVFMATRFNPAPARLVLNEHVVGVEKAPGQGNAIAAVISRNVRTGVETRWRARLFADCSGDAVLARMMGAETMYGREARSRYGESLAPLQADRQVMGLSVLWYAAKTPHPSEFPDVDWGLAFNEGNACFVKGSDWDWETGQYRDQVIETEYIRDYGMMAVFANWSFLKNHSRRRAEWAAETLAWVSPLGGKRESHRVVGDYVLNQNDIENGVCHPDATGSMTWSLDLHFPDPENAGRFAEPFRSCAYHRGIAKPYPVPYRCLYARDVGNLFLGGRAISVSHVAFSCVRVMRTLGVLGEVIGLAASLCVRKGILPRDVYSAHFDDLQAMMREGVPTPTYHAYQCGISESYHFIDTGHLSIIPRPDNLHRFDDPALKQRIKSLDVQHLHRHPGLDE